MPRVSAPKVKRELRTPQQARSRRTREKILLAAVACFEEHGYDATTTAAIAKRARIGVGSLYGYFQDKRAILLEVWEKTSSEIANYIISSLDPEKWSEAKSRASVRRLIDALFHARTFNPGMQRIIWERYFKDPDFREVVQATEMRVRAAMVELFAVLKAQGKLRVSDVASAAFVVHTSVEWTASRIMLGSFGAEIDPAVEATSDMVSRYLFHDSKR